MEKPTLGTKAVNSDQSGTGLLMIKSTFDMLAQWALVGVGIWGVCAALKTLRAIKEQARIARVGLSATRIAANAARASANAAVESNKLTIKSNEITKDATELTRQSIALTHRPKLIVRHVIVRPPEATSPQDLGGVAAVAHTLASNGGQLHIVNIGDSAAKITRIHSEMFQGERLPMAPPYDEKPGQDRDLSIAPGAYFYLPFPSERYVQQTSMVRVDNGWEHFWALGWIEYTDSVRTLRRTAFCRKWLNEQAQFVPVGESPYEYAD